MVYGAKWVLYALEVSSLGDFKILQASKASKIIRFSPLNLQKTRSHIMSIMKSKSERSGQSNSRGASGFRGRSLRGISALKTAVKQSGYNHGKFIWGLSSGSMLIYVLKTF